jgi:hypothetical protein
MEDQWPRGGLGSMAEFPLKWILPVTGNPRGLPILALIRTSAIPLGNRPMLHCNVNRGAFIGSRSQHAQ